MRIHIVTDSNAHFAHPQLMAQYPVTVVPNTLHIAGQAYREGVDITTEQALELIAHQMTPPQVDPPSVEDYLAVYTHLAGANDAVISIHASRVISKSWYNARVAAEQMQGALQMTVIDSRTLDAAQGLVVRAAARVIEATNDLDEVIRVVRAATERAYAIYYVEDVEYIMRNGLMSPSHAILSKLHETYPLLTVEDGALLTIEKVRTRGQAVDRLVDFAIEFVDLEDALILYHRAYMSEQTRTLQNRLTTEFEDRHFPHALYGPALASLIGTEATGLVILESAWDELE
ncbi:MAG: DegV family protein [Chloroflexota bacterium]